MLLPGSVGQTVRIGRALLLTGVALGLAGCEPAHEIALKEPTREQVEAAIKRFNEITPALRTGRWEVATANPNVQLDGADKQSADELRAMGAALNTTPRCRRNAAAIDSNAETAITVNFREGCKVDRLTADPGKLSWEARCTMGTSILKEKVSLEIAPDRFVTDRSTSIGHNGDEEGETRTLRYTGHYAGTCGGDERAQPTFWSDPR